MVTKNDLHIVEEPFEVQNNIIETQTYSTELTTQSKKNNINSPDLPIAVMVEFENYRGPAFNENQPLCIPICPITVALQTEIGIHERQQLLLRLAWTLTIHKSQGLTLPKAWIDIGKSERTTGVSYVAISRMKTLASCVIELMTYERLTSLKSSANLQYRLEEENRLDQFAQTTNSSAMR